MDPVHHQGVRLSLGVFRTSPIQSLYVEAREPSLENRRLKLSLQYTVKLKTNPLNPAHACVFHPANTSRYTVQSPCPFGPSASAKTARRTDMHPCLIPPSDFKPIIRKHITTMWQNTWDESPLNKLHEITPIVNEPRTHHLSTRKDQSIFNKCRIGHSHLTLQIYNCPLTIKHLLIECVDFNDVRQRFYQVPSLQDLFKTVKPEVILEFSKAAALYRLL